MGTREIRVLNELKLGHSMAGAARNINITLGAGGVVLIKKHEAFFLHPAHLHRR